MIAAVESYLAVRRAAGFTLSDTEYLLRSFAAFATDKKQTHIRTATAIDWASQAGSVAQRHTRYQTICRFAQYLRVEDSRHESPPANHFGYRKTRRVPHIYSRDEIEGLVLAATRLPCVGFVTAKDVCGADQPAGSNRAANLGGVASAGLRHHSRRFANPQNQVSEDPIGAVARHRRDGVGSLLDAPSRSATWRRRPPLRFGATGNHSCTGKFTACSGPCCNRQGSSPRSVDGHVFMSFATRLRSGHWNRLQLAVNESGSTCWPWLPIWVTSTSTLPTGTWKPRPNFCATSRW